jgi:predicted nucleic acid-binding protein
MSESDTAPNLYFVDTNVWLYAFVAGSDVDKSERARQLLHDNGASLVVSSQVINEICVNLLKKAHLPEAEIVKEDGPGSESHSRPWYAKGKRPLPCRSGRRAW